MVKVLKHSVNSIAIYVYNENIEADTIQVSTLLPTGEKKDNGSQEYFSDTIEYVFDKIDKFVGWGVDNFIFEINFIKDNKIIKKVQVTTTNYPNKPFQKGIINVKKHEFLIKAKKVNGTKLLLLKKLNKEYCNLCWDEDMQASKNSNCSQCGGTGFIEKYSKPILTWGYTFNDNPEFSPVTEGGKEPFKSSYGAYSITLLADFLVDQDDLIFVNNNGDLTKVNNVVITYFANIPLTQRASINSLPTDSPVFKNIKKELDKKIKEIHAIY